MRFEHDLIIQQAKIRSDNEALITKIEKIAEFKWNENWKTKSWKLSNTTVKADVNLYSKQREAESIVYLKLKEAEGLKNLVNAFDGKMYKL